MAWKSRLLGWQDNHKFPFNLYKLESKTRITLQEQDLINWINFIGRMRKRWEKTQDEWIVMTSTNGNVLPRDGSNKLY